MSANGKSRHRKSLSESPRHSSFPVEKVGDQWYERRAPASSTGTTPGGVSYVAPNVPVKQFPKLRKGKGSTKIGTVVQTLKGGR